MGAPQRILSDQGQSFVSTLPLLIFKTMNIIKSITTVYHPQCNGLTERFNRTLDDMIAKVVNHL